MKSRRVQFPAGIKVGVLDVPAVKTAAAKKHLLKPTHGEIMAGFHTHTVTEVAEKLGISAASMAERIGVARSTFHRKQKDDALLTEHESDALARHSSLLDQAIAVFDGDEEAARQWLGCPQVGLGNAVPLDFARTTFGYREVEKLLTRIDHGVYA
jgi:putative toxin-antitoxin system antitoxin component (TIGR02293 family)